MPRTQVLGKARGFGDRPLLLIGVLLVIVSLSGFLSFIDRVPWQSAPASLNAEGIVVLTGGPKRVEAGLRLLSQGRGERLLISGVGAGTTKSDLAEVEGYPDRLFECCVDLGYEAVHTAGNAREAADWARRQNVRSLIIVTAHYHMPRAMLEMERALPNTQLIAYPVFSPATEDGRPRTDITAVRLLTGEYVKYVGSLLGFGPR